MISLIFSHIGSFCSIAGIGLTLLITKVWTILSCQDFRSGVKYGLSTLLHL